MTNDNSDLTSYLKCDVELELSGPSSGLLDKSAADVLRALADRIEKGEFEDGHHEVTDKDGNPAGTIYVDYSEGT